MPTFITLKKWFSYKIQAPALRYLILIHCSTGEVLWLSDAYPGATGEVTIFGDVAQYLMEEEKIFGYRIYSGNNLMNTRGMSNAERNIYDGVRALVERRIKSLRVFRIMKMEWRETCENTYQFHQDSVYVLAQLTNYYFKNRKDK